METRHIFQDASLSKSEDNMALQERRIVKQVTFVTVSDSVNVQWANQIVKDDEVIAETLHRKAYSRSTASEFAAEVENAAAYMQALGWTLDG